MRATAAGPLRHELRALPECRYHIWVVG